MLLASIRRRSKAEVEESSHETGVETEAYERVVLVTPLDVDDYVEGQDGT